MIAMWNRRRRTSVATFILAFLPMGTASVPGQVTQRPTLSPEDYDQWESLRGEPILSRDGRWLAYRVERVNRERELRVQDLEGEPARIIPWGEAPVFSADSAWLAWSIGVSDAERKRLKKANKPVRNGAGFLALTTGEQQTREEILSFSFDASGRFLALVGYAPEEPKGQGAHLTLIDLRTNSALTFGNVAEHSWSETGSLLALAVATGKDAGNGVQVYDALGGRLRSLDSSGSSYRGLAWREDATDLAVLRSVAAASVDKPGHTLLAWRGLAGSDPDRFVLDGAVAGVAQRLEVVRYGGPLWSDNGRRLAFGLRPKEASADDDETDADAEDSQAPGDDPDRAPMENDEKGAESDELPGLQIWHTADVRIFPGQKAAVKQDEQRVLRAIWHLEEARVVQLGSDLMATVELLEGWNHALERVTSPYEWGTKFGRPYHDVWSVEVASGQREKLLERVRYSWGSAGGRYLLSFDGRHYRTHDLTSGKGVNVTQNLPAVFANTEYDTPTDLLPPHGVGGWLEEDAAVFLYDRFDIWRVVPDGSRGERVTRGAEEEIVHRVVDLDPDEEAIAPEAPIYLSVHGEWSERRGYARLPPGSATAERLVFRDKMIRGLRKAEDVDVFIYRSEARDDSPDYWVAELDFAAARQVTRTNPFQDHFAWTRSELFEFESQTGRRLQAGLLYPALHDPTRRYPMIVYTYELLSPQIHLYEVPSEHDYYNFTTWTQRGYFVLMPDIVYRARDPGVSAIEAVCPAVAKVVERGLVDANRVGLVGHSWGGYQATYLPTRIHIFAASVAGAPLTDFVSFMGQIHWRPGIAELDHWETGQARMEVPYWEDPEAHHRNSPIHGVHQLETPLLMAFGSEDGVVDWDQGTEFYNFARRAGKQMVMLVYEGEGHGFREEPNQIDYHRRILEWFGHYLKGDPAPAWITKGVPLKDLEKEKRRVAEKRKARGTRTGRF